MTTCAWKFTDFFVSFCGGWGSEEGFGGGIFGEVRGIGGVWFLGMGACGNVVRYVWCEWETGAER